MSMMPPSNAAEAATTASSSTNTPPSLMRRSLRSSGWTLMSTLAQQGLRFGTNVMLAYLLAGESREAFGLMMFVSLWMVGLAMFSDVGIGPSIIQTRRGDDPTYLNTAWTIQVIRGLALSVCAAALAYPVSILWHEPALRYLLPVVGLTAAISGFNATSLFTLNRSLTIGKVVALQLGAQAVSVVVMGVWAWFAPSVWALVAGGIAGSLCTMLVSHRLVTPTNRLRWDRDSARELYLFGRWVFFSTAFTFLGGRIAQFIMPALLGFALMGVFSVANSMCTVVPIIAQRFTSMVGFPALADLYRRDEDRFRWRLRHVRAVLVIPVCAALLAVAVVGPWVIDLAYPQVFHGAGWMLTALAIGEVAVMVNNSYGNAYLSMGRVSWITLSVVVHFVLVVPAIVWGNHLAGAVGFIYAMAGVNWAMYPLNMVLAIRARIWHPEIDLPVLLIGGGAGYYLLFL